MSESVLVVDSITKRYGDFTAVRGLSLTVPAGSVYGLLGPNGAGKTTTIRMIMSIIGPDEGHVRLFGGEATGRAASARIGYLPEERGLYRKMKVLDLLVFLAEMKGMRRAAAKGEAQAWLERLGLDGWGSKRADNLSKGMQQKVQFISTVLHRPELVVLDEPFAGLDPVNAQVLKDTVLQLARDGSTILFSTHIMEQAEKLCDAVCIIARGAKVLDGELSAVKRTRAGRNVVVAVERGVALLDGVLRDRSIVAKADNYGQYAEIELQEGTDPQRLLQAVLSTGARLTRFEITEPSLHKIFIDAVGPDAATASAEGAPHA